MPLPCRQKDEVSLGRCYLLSRTMADKSVFHSSMSNRLSDRHPCRGVLHTPHIDSTSTPSPLAGRLVRRMQYAPTFPEKNKVSLGRYFLLSRTIRDEYVFHSSISNRLSDRCPCRAQKHTPLARLSSTPTPFAGRLVRRMQYAPTLPAEKSDLKGWWEVTFGTRKDKYVFNSIMSNRLSDRYPCRAQKHTPLARLSSTRSPLAGRLVGRMQYAPTLPKKDEVSLGWCFPSSQTIRDEYVFHFSMSTRLSDRYPCRGVLNTPPARLSSTLSPFVVRLVGRMQYAPTLPKKDEVSLGWCFPSSQTIRDEYVFHFIISNRLSDGDPGRGVLHTPHIDLTSTLSPLARRIVGRMQYAPTFPEKDKVSSCRCFLLSRTIADQYASFFSMFNRLSDRYPCRTQKHTPLAHLSSTLSPLAGRLVGRMQYAPTLPKKEEVSSGRCYLLSRTMADQYIFHFFMSNRLSNRHPGRAQKNTPPARLSSTLSPLTGRLVGAHAIRPYIVGKKGGFLG